MRDGVTLAARACCCWFLMSGRRWLRLRADVPGAAYHGKNAQVRVWNSLGALCKMNKKNGFPEITRKPFFILVLFVLQKQELPLKAAQVHHLIPCGNKVIHKLLIRIGAGIYFCDGAQF